MFPESLLPWLAWRLFAASVQGALAIALVWLVSRGIASPAVRAWLWWVAALGLVVSLLPVPSLDVAVPFGTWGGAAIDTPSATRGIAPSGDTSGHVAAAEPRASHGRSRLQLLSIAAIGIWGVAVTWQSLRLLAAYRRLRTVVQRATPLDARETPAIDRLAALMGLSTTPAVRVTANIEAPLVVGIRRPTVLFPQSTLEALSSDERDMAICHEFAHIRRRDLAFGWIPAIAERGFFFHPLVRRAVREYGTEREAACDAQVLRATGVNAQDYGRMLVRLGVTNVRSVLAAGGSSSSLSSLKRRLIMLKEEHGDRARRWTIAWVAAGVALVMVPFELVAGPIALRPVPFISVARPADHDAQTQPANAAPAAPSRQVQRAQSPQRTVDERQQIAAAIAARRAQMAKTEQSLASLKRELEALYVRQQQMLESTQAKPSVAQQQEIAAALSRLAAETRAVEQQRAQQALEEQMQALVDKQEALGATLRQVAEQIDAIRKQIETTK